MDPLIFGGVLINLIFEKMYSRYLSKHQRKNRQVPQKLTFFKAQIGFEFHKRFEKEE